MKKISNNPKFRIPNSAFLIFLVLVNLLGLFSLTASAEKIKSGTWGEMTPEGVLSYADFSFMYNHSGDAEDPYEISTAAQLAGLAALVNEYDGSSVVLTDAEGNTATATNFFKNSEHQHVKLTADIDLSEHSWVPIGIDTNFAVGATAVFSGVFDGAGHTVSGMTIGTRAMPEEQYQNAGLFGYVIMGEIKNLTVSGSVNLSSPSAKDRVGGLVGYLYAGRVINCHSQVNVTVSQNTTGAPCYVGGVVGHGAPAEVNRDTHINGCTNSGTVTVTCTCSEISACYVGGVAGYIENMNSPFINCFNSGSVTGGQYTGGVVGYATNDHEVYRNMRIYNCANVGSVTGDGYVGGILGGADSSMNIENGYHAGDVSGANAGGIVGDANNAGASFCYWLSTSAESASGDGEGYFYDCSALSEAQMKAAAGTTDESWEPLHRANAPIALVDALNAYARGYSIYNVTCTQWHICSAAGASLYPTYESCSYTDNSDGNTHKKQYECCEAVVDAEDHFGDDATCLGTVCEGCGAYYGDTNSTYHVSMENVYRPDETEPYDYHNQYHACCGALIEDTQEWHNDFTYTMEQINDSEQYVFTKTCLTCNGVVGKQYITVADRPYDGTWHTYAMDESEGDFGLLEGTYCHDGGCIDEGEHTLTFDFGGQHKFEISFTITEHTENDHVFAPKTPGENATCTDNKDGTHSFTCTVCEEPVTAAHDFDSNELECGVCHASAVSIHGQQLNIGSDLSMKYYVEVFNSALDVEKLKMIFTINDVVIEVYAEAPNAEGFYVFTLNGINPQCMGDNIYAKLFYDGVEVANHGYDEKYSVEINLGNLLKKYPDDEALVALIKDTLAYGKAAEEYIGHTSIEGDYTGTDREIPESELITSTEGDLRVHQATVRFGTMNHIVLMIESKNGAPTVKVGEQSVDVTLYAENSSYYVSVLHGVSATDFGNDITVTISDGTTTVDYTVSINDYLYAISQSSTDEKMVNLAKALYNYGVSAKIYNHVKTDVVEYIGGEATCISGKICDICKTVYSEVDSTNHASENYTYTDNGDGTHTKKHECCGATAGEPEDHIYEYTYNSNDTHSFTCTVCDISGNENHTFTDEACTVCGLIDATEMTAESLNTTVTKVLTEGKTDITVSLAADAPAEMFTAIRRALIDTEGVKDGSINLTIAGVTAIPNHSDSPSDYSLIFGNVGHNENGNMLDTHEVVTQLASVNLPDATSIGDDAFKECENLTVLIAPKVQTIGQYAFAHTNLTSIDLPEATTLKAGAFLNCSNITEFNLPKVTVLGYVALDIDYWTLNTYDSERTIYLTTSDEIKVDTGCFYGLVDVGLLETHVNLVLNSNKQSEVSGNTWTTKDANGNTVSFTFKSITIEG
ncbi:MAG: leucine-rich repeat domain-containing protein [Clostridia bacterium]|nr:leucine-rich repeat domain-containing protein [Clostridia bacterium]